MRLTWFFFLSVDGKWGEWGAWSKCSKTCGGGEHERVRQCNSPAPAYGGKPCEGPFRQRRLCNKENCPGDSGYRMTNIARWLLFVCLFSSSSCCFFFFNIICFPKKLPTNDSLTFLLLFSGW